MHSMCACTIHYHNNISRSSLPFALDDSVVNTTVTDVSRYPCRTPIVKFSVPLLSTMVRFVLRNPITATGVNSGVICKCTAYNNNH